LGFHTHHDALRSLPHAGVDSWQNVPRFINGTGASAEQQWAGWGYQVLPYIEQDQVFAGSGNASVGNPPIPPGTDDYRRVVAISTAIPVFYCPTRRPAKPNPPTGSWYAVNPNSAQLGAPGNYPHGQTDYASAFVDPGAAGRPTGTGSPWIVAGSTWRSGAVVRLGLIVGTTGESQPNPARNERPVIGMEGLSDGTANVILLGEKRLNAAFTGQYQSDDNEGYTSGWDHDVNRNASKQPLPDYRGSGDGNQRFGSSHPSGFQVVMGDGAVKFVPFTVNQLLFHRLGYRNDGQSASAPTD
jgi:hypothetical protein